MEQSLSIKGASVKMTAGIGELAGYLWRTYSLSFSRTFCDSSSRSCRALSLHVSSSTVLMFSHSCLLRSWRFTAHGKRAPAKLGEPFPLRLSQSSGFPSRVLEGRTDSDTSCQKRKRDAHKFQCAMQ